MRPRPVDHQTPPPESGTEGPAAVLAPPASRLPVAADWRTWASIQRAAAQAPYLEADEEDRLIQAVQDYGDRAAAWRLVWAHLRLVAACVRHHRQWGLPPDDLAQEGVVGLMKALKGFRRDLGYRFATYAKPWVNAEIRGYILRNLRLVQIGSSKALRRLFFGYHKALHEREAGAPGTAPPATPTAADLARALSIPEDQARAGLAWMQGRDVPIDTPDDAPRASLALPAPEHERPESVMLAAERQAQRQALHVHVGHLPAREADVIRRRWLAAPPETLQDVARTWGVSVERVRQIETRAVGLLRARLGADHPGWVAPVATVRA